MGSPGGTALPGPRRPARRLAPGQSGPHLRRTRGRPSMVRPQPRHQDVPDPQPRALPLVRHRAGRRSQAAERSGQRHAGGPAPGAHPRRRHARVTLNAAGGRRPRAAHHRTAAAVRRLHRRRRTGRSGCGCVRGFGRSEHGHRRAGGTGGPGGTECGDRELPGLSQGAERLRPGPTSPGPGDPVRRRARAGSRRRGLRGPRAGARGDLRRFGRDRGPGADRGDGRLLPATCGGRAGGADRARRLLRRHRQRGQPVPGRRGLRRGRRQLRRPGGVEPVPFRQARGAGGPGRFPGEHHVAVPDRPACGGAQHRGALLQ